MTRVTAILRVALLALAVALVTGCGPARRPDGGVGLLPVGAAAPEVAPRPARAAGIGTAVPGLYRLSYDYDPATKQVRRTVALIKAGGVDPNAPGIVTVIQKNLDDAAGKNASPLPDFNKIAAPTPH